MGTLDRLIPVIIAVRPQKVPDSALEVFLEGHEVRNAGRKRTQPSPLFKCFQGLQPHGTATVTSGLGAPKWGTGAGEDSQTSKSSRRYLREPKVSRVRQASACQKPDVADKRIKQSVVIEMLDSLHLPRLPVTGPCAARDAIIMIS